MKFVIYREVDGKRKTLVEWNRFDVELELEKELKIPAYVISKALSNIIEKFKKETIRIP